MPSRRDGGSDLHGILLVDKPPGWTSHDVVAKVRRLSGQRKIGHTGTLDPMATGLLVLCLGDATRLVEYMSAHDKRYEGIVTLGTTTDSDDADGAVIEQRPVPAIDEVTLERAVSQLRGTILQRPPAFSAMKKDGQRAYAIARRGGDPGLGERPVTVHDLVAARAGGVTISLAVHCGPGTYVRSLARDLGEAIGCGAHLSALRRTTVGGFDVANAFSMEQLEAAGAGRIEGLLAAPDEGIRQWPAALLGGRSACDFVHGTTLEAAWTGCAADADETMARVFTGDGLFAGVAQVARSGRIRPIKVMANAAKTILMSLSDSEKA